MMGLFCSTLRLNFIILIFLFLEEAESPLEQEVQPRADDSGLAPLGRAEPGGEGGLHQESQEDERPGGGQFLWWCGC